MKKNMTLSRRGFFKGAAVASGAAVGSRIISPFEREARAADPERAAVVVLFLNGGYNSLFGSADSFLQAGTFGVNAQRVMMLGGEGGLAVDAQTLGTLPTFARTHMATIGVRHGISDHGVAQNHDWSNGTTNYGVVLADAIGGPAAIKGAHVGGNMVPRGNVAVNGTTLQQINDMGTTITALGGTVDATLPNRAVGSMGIMAAQDMSKVKVDNNPRAMLNMKNGYKTAIETLQKPVKAFDRAEFLNAYNLGTNTGINSFASKMAAAELMVRSGTNVVTIQDGGWDSHGDRDGNGVRTKLGGMMGAINTFAARMIDPAGAGQNPETPRNVIFMIMGDFARSLPGSDHQPNMSATVIGKYVKTGTTGKVAANVSLPAGVGQGQQLWSFVAAASKVTANPFGANPHALVL